MLKVIQQDLPGPANSAEIFYEESSIDLPDPAASNEIFYEESGMDLPLPR